MALFPFFRNIEGAEALVIGGGKHALEKVERLLPYGPRLHVIAEEVCPKLVEYAGKTNQKSTDDSPLKTVIKAEAMPAQKEAAEQSGAAEQNEAAERDKGADPKEIASQITISRRKFVQQDLTEQIDFVIVAGENPAENHWIAGLCRARRIPVNVVDDQEYCDFIFPSLIARGSLSVGICTNGASPSTGVLLKKKIEAQIPDNIEEILDFLQEKRAEIKGAIHDKKKRFAFYYRLSEICMEEDRALTEEEFRDLLSGTL